MSLLVNSFSILTLPLAYTLGIKWNFISWVFMFCKATLCQSPLLSAVQIQFNWTEKVSLSYRIQDLEDKMQPNRMSTMKRKKKKTMNLKKNTLGGLLTTVKNFTLLGSSVHRLWCFFFCFFCTHVIFKICGSIMHKIKQIQTKSLVWSLTSRHGCWMCWFEYLRNC